VAWDAGSRATGLARPGGDRALVPVARGDAGLGRAAGGQPGDDADAPGVLGPAVEGGAVVAPRVVRSGVPRKQGSRSEGSLRWPGAVEPRAGPGGLGPTWERGSLAWLRRQAMGGREALRLQSWTPARPSLVLRSRFRAVLPGVAAVVQKLSEPVQDLLFYGLAPAA
jgi:hypothetical protein